MEEAVEEAVEEEANRKEGSSVPVRKVRMVSLPISAQQQVGHFEIRTD